MTLKNNTRVAIIGGGASGLMCANLISRKSEAISIDIFEKNERVGKKLAVTGNGCCNISNAKCDSSRYYNVDKKSHELTNKLLNKYDSEKCMAYFEEIGLKIVENEDGKLYPSGKQASAVIDVMRIENFRFGVNEICSYNIDSIKKTGDKFILESKSNKSSKNTTYDAVVFCGGSEASPKLGGSNSSYKILESIGHSSTSRYPTLVAAFTDTSKTKQLKGQKLMANVSLVCAEDTIKSVYGELLFTGYGLSGPPIFQLTGHAETVRITKGDVDLSFSIDFLPEIDFDILVSNIQMRVVNIGYKTLEDFLSGWLNKQLGRSLFSAIGIKDRKRIAYTLNQSEILSLANALKDWRIIYFSSRGFEHAQVCAGGIKLCEFDENLQSKLCENLFVAGEILDVHADSGGFNLQWAWSSAYCVANNILELFS